MTPYELVEKKFADARRDGEDKPKYITLPVAAAELFLREAIKRKPWYLTLKLGKITYRGARLVVMTEAQFKEAQKKHREEHPIEIPEAPKIILPGQLERV